LCHLLLFRLLTLNVTCSPILQSWHYCMSDICDEHLRNELWSQFRDHSTNTSTVFHPSS
jgi:hypothetical protein